MSLTSSAPRAAPVHWVTITGAIVLLFGYVAVRAYRLSITHDEAWTYALYIKRGFTDILLYRTPGLPDNNHLLLSLLAKVSIGALGLSEFAERLPTVAAFALFLGCVAGVLRMYLGGILFWAYFLFIAANPYVIDLMTLARGYGLGIALMTAGLWVLLRHPLPATRARFLAAEAWFAAAALAHFTFLLPFIALLGWHGLTLLTAWRAGQATGRLVVRQALAASGLTAGLAVIVMRPLGIMRKYGLLALPTEGHTSFHVDTVRSLIVESCYGSASPMAVAGIAVVCYAAVAAAVALLAWGAHLRRFTPAWTALGAVTWLLLATAAGSVLQHHLFGVNYLQERQAAFMIPLFGLMCALIAANADLLPRLRWPALAAAAFALAWLPGFAVAVNVTATRDWTYDADTRDMMQHLRDTAGKDGRKFSLGTRWWHAPGVGFYADKYELAGLTRSTIGPVYERFDYYYLPRDEAAALTTAQGPMRVIAIYEKARATLFARSE